MPPLRSRRVGAALALIGLFALAGCIQIGVHATVAADGTVEEYEMRMNVSRTAYGFIEQSAEEEGFDSVGEYMLSDLGDEASSEDSLFGGLNRSETEKIRYDENFHGDQVTMIITAEDFEPTSDGPISIERNGSRLVYEDRTFVNESGLGGEGEGSELSESMAAGFAVDYTLTMPGEIVDSNADEVDGNTAVWHASGADAFVDNRIYAESEVPTETSLPGFGVPVALLALATLGLLGVAAARRRS